MATDLDRLRLRIGESIPVGGTESDTLFTDDQMDIFLEEDSLDLATASAWEAKAAALSTLVTTAEGASKRELSDAYKAAERQAEIWRKKTASSSLSGRVKIGIISRPEITRQ